MHYLEYVTKSDKAMHTILFRFKTALFFSFLVVYCIARKFGKVTLFEYSAKESLAN